MGLQAPPRRPGTDGRFPLRNRRTRVSLFPEGGGALGEKRLLSVREAAAQAGVSPQYIRRMLRKNVLKGFRVGRVWLLDEDAVFEWIARRTVGLRVRTTTPGSAQCRPEGDE